MSESQDEYATDGKPGKFNNTLPFWGNEGSMNLNSLILTNIQSSTYFKVSLFKLKTYHEVIDEIYYQVKHMEPWEKGSRKTSGQTGMCGGVRGVGAGGIVSSAFCLLYKLYTLRLTRKQLNGLLNHTDSPYIRALGFMYIRYTQPPADLYGWYEEYLSDEEEIDVKAGGGQLITIGQMVVQFLTKLDWCGTLFPRIPVPIQKQIQSKLEEYAHGYGITIADMTGVEVGGNNNKQLHGQRARQASDYGDKGRNNSYDNHQQHRANRAEGGGGSETNGGGSRSKGYDGGRGRNNYDEDRYQAPSSSSSSTYYDRPAKYSRSRSRSPPPTARDRSKYYDSDRPSGGSGSHRNRRRSPSVEDRYESYARRGGEERDRVRDRDDVYRERDGYGGSSSSKRRY